MTEQELTAMGTVQKYSMIAAGVGLIPIPVLDMAGLAAVQVAMVRSIANQYGQTMGENWGKATITALIGGAVPTGLASGTAGMLVRQIPLVGSMLGFVTLSAFATAVTYAVGTVFIRHFESGGTLLDFNAEDAREAFTREFQKARSKA